MDWTITMRGKEDEDPNIKQLLTELRKSEHPDNPYRFSSESNASKALIKEALIQAHKKFTLPS